MIFEIDMSLAISLEKLLFVGMLLVLIKVSIHPPEMQDHDTYTSMMRHRCSMFEFGH